MNSISNAKDVLLCEYKTNIINYHDNIFSGKYIPSIEPWTAFFALHILLWLAVGRGGDSETASGHDVSPSINFTR